MKTLKRILSLLICLTLTIPILPALPAFAETYSGTCGDNLTWTLDDSVLTISGTGDMTNFNYPDYAPWYEYRTNIISVTIGGSITSIGSSAFSNHTALTSVTIPDSVTSVGSSAFWDCRSLASIEIPDSVTSIGSSAFFRCSNLTSVTIGSGVTSIDAQTFCYSGLTNITIGNNVTSIGESAFCGTSLTSVTIPDSVTTIGNGAFWGCNDLTSVTIGSNVTSIDYNAFADCTSLTSITIPKSVTTIGNSAFSGCGSLNITVDSDNPYYSSVDGVLFNKNQTEIISYSKDEICPDYTIPDSVTTIGEWAFHSCSFLTNVIIGNNVTSIESAAFYSCSALTSVAIGSSVTSIRELAFYSCFDLASITIPNGVTSIDKEVFCFCSSLASIAIPNSVTSIGDYAFDACSSLTDVYYSGSEDEWAAISLGWCNECLTDAAIHYNSSTADGEIKVYLNGTMLSFDQPPIMINNRTMVPLRAIFEAMGYNVEWNNDTQTAQAVKNSDTITVQIGNNTVSYVTNGQSGTYVCDVAPQIISDRTLVPARAIAESAGCTVEWDGSTQTVTITANTEN